MGNDLKYGGALGDMRCNLAGELYQKFYRCLNHKGGKNVSGCIEVLGDIYETRQD